MCQQEILDILKSNPDTLQTDLPALTGLSKQTISHNLKALVSWHKISKQRFPLPKGATYKFTILKEK